MLIHTSRYSVSFVFINTILWIPNVFFIPDPGPCFCFGKAYIESFCLDYLAGDTDFFLFKIIFILTIKTYINGVAPLIIRTFASGGWSLFFISRFVLGCDIEFWNDHCAVETGKNGEWQNSQSFVNGCPSPKKMTRRDNKEWKATSSNKKQETVEGHVFLQIDDRQNKQEEKA